MNLLLNVLWALAVIARLFCAATLLHRGLAKTYWALFAASLITGLSQLAGLLIWWIGGAAQYTASWMSFGRYQFAWDALLVVAVIHSAARHFPRAFWFATGASAIFSAVSVVAAAAVSRVGRADQGFAVEAAMYVARNFAAFCLVLSAWVIFYFSRMAGKTALRPNALAIMIFTAALFALQFIGSAIYAVSAKSYTGRAVAQMFIIGAPAMCYLGYALRVTPNGEQWAGFSVEEETGGDNGAAEAFLESLSLRGRRE